LTPGAFGPDGIPGRVEADLGPPDPPRLRYYILQF
jgi:hypothetical protein